MGKRYDSLRPRQQQFIGDQKIFFVGTAGDDTTVNISPKGMDSLRVLDARQIVWLNVTGSGNETAAHLLENDRITLMWCAFEGAPMILRVYGRARIYHPSDPEWAQWIDLFPPLPGARQIIELKIEKVQTSCGMAVPVYSFEGDRDALNRWAEKKGEAGIRDYWQEKNTLSLDGNPTGMALRKKDST